MRRFFTHRKTLALLAALLAIGVVWLATRGPREPVYQGHKLSWWVSYDPEIRDHPDFRELTREDLLTLGPDGIEWLGYWAARASIWDLGESSPDASRWRRYLGWVRSRWFHEAYDRSFESRGLAIAYLGELGPDAAPAIPSLLKAVRYEGCGAAETLIRMGDVAWPAILDALPRSDNWTREVLLRALDERWKWPYLPPMTPAEFAGLIELLARLSAKSDPASEGLAGVSMAECAGWWRKQPKREEGVQLVLDRIMRLDVEPREHLIETCRLFFSEDTIVLPFFKKAAESPDEMTRVKALHALIDLEWPNRSWREQLQELAASPNPAVAQEALLVLARVARVIVE